MVPRAQPAAVDEKLLSELVQVAFSQRRKILRHTLGKWLEQKNFSGAFDTQRRAEEVPVDEYLKLAAADPAMKKPVARSGLSGQSWPGLTRPSMPWLATRIKTAVITVSFTPLRANNPR